MQLSSSAFQDQHDIPSEFTCDGVNVSPPLSICDVPAEAKSLALIMDDPDAPMGIFVHWVVWNISPDTGKIMKGALSDAVLKFSQGKTGFGTIGYGGPCPPSGTHHYFFKLYALDIVLDLPEASIKSDLEKVMTGHILAEAQLMGTYQRRGNFSFGF